MSYIFPIAMSAPGDATSSLAVAGFVLALVIVLFAGIVYSARNVRFDMTREGLRIRGDIYGRLVPNASLVPSEAKKVDLGSGSPYKLRIRTNGIGTPWYKSGWFRLSNGEKALVFLTNTSRAVYVPTVDGYCLLLTPADPDAFIAKLRTHPAALQ